MNTHTRKISKYTPGMLQGELQFQVVRPREGLVHEYAFEKRAFLILATALLALIFMYLYLVASTIFNVMGRAEAERNIRNVETSLASLEQQYLALSNSITAETATADGFAPVDSVSYVYRPGNTALAQMDHNNL